MPAGLTEALGLEGVGVRPRPALGAQDPALSTSDSAPLLSSHLLQAPSPVSRPPSMARGLSSSVFETLAL